MTDERALHGRCHCGNLTLEFQPARPVAELTPRACACTFCVPRRARWTSDPDGRVAITIAREAELSRYRFGTGTAEFLICRRCGYLVAAITDDQTRAVINLDVLDRAAEFRDAPLVDIDGEALDARLARRARNWTPAALTVGG